MYLYDLLPDQASSAHQCALQNDDMKAQQCFDRCRIGHIPKLQRKTSFDISKTPTGGMEIFFKFYKRHNSGFVVEECKEIIPNWPVYLNVRMNFKCACKTCLICFVYIPRSSSSPLVRNVDYFQGIPTRGCTFSHHSESFRPWAL